MEIPHKKDQICEYKVLKLKKLNTVELKNSFLKDCYSNHQGELLWKFHLKKVKFFTLKLGNFKNFSLFFKILIIKN